MVVEILIFFFFFMEKGCVIFRTSESFCESWRHGYLSSPRKFIWVPLQSCVPAKITLSKRCPFLTLFFIAWLQNSHNDAFHKLMKSELF